MEIIYPLTATMKWAVFHPERGDVGQFATRKGALRFAGKGESVRRMRLQLPRHDCRCLVTPHGPIVGVW